MNRMALLLAPVCLVFSSATPAAEWNGHLATLFDARIACTDTESHACEPYLAEAVAVADTLQEIAAVEVSGSTTKVFATFHGMERDSCTVKWFQSLNGLSLLHNALGLAFDPKESKSIYWTKALIWGSRQLCRS